MIMVGWIITFYHQYTKLNWPCWMYLASLRRWAWKKARIQTDMTAWVPESKQPQTRRESKLPPAPPAERSKRYYWPWVKGLWAVPAAFVKSRTRLLETHRLGFPLCAWHQKTHPLPGRWPRWTETPRSRGPTTSSSGLLLDLQHKAEAHWQFNNGECEKN